MLYGGGRASTKQIKTTFSPSLTRKAALVLFSSDFLLLETPDLTNNVAFGMTKKSQEKNKIK